MKKLKKILLTIFISLILSVIGMLIYESLFEILLPKIDDIKYVMVEINGQFIPSLQFGLTLGIMPALLLLIWNKVSVVTTNKKLLSIAIVLTSMALAIIVRYQMLILHFKKVKSIQVEVPNNNFNYDYSFPIENLKYENYIFFGMIFGCLIAYVILRKKKEAFNAEIL